MTNPFLEQVIQLAVANVHAGGGPFAALVVKDGTVIATGRNQVTRSKDPTAHAEIVAIREACRALATFQLKDCELYCSCEPCPMCLGAIFWARLGKVFFAATHADAAAAGFDDALIYRQFALPHSERSIPMIHVIEPRSTRPFEEWVSFPHKEAY